MKLLMLTTLSMIFFVQDTTGQTKTTNRYINNDSIGFELISVMPDLGNGIFYSDYALVVNSLDSAGRVFVKAIDKKK